MKFSIFMLASGAVYSQLTGIADIDTKEFITTITLFNIGSISKTFVAYGVLGLASENKFSPDNDLYKYLPDFKTRIIAQKVNLVHLLTHRSRITDRRPLKKHN